MQNSTPSGKAEHGAAGSHGRQRRHLPAHELQTSFRMGMNEGQRLTRTFRGRRLERLDIFHYCIDALRLDRRSFGVILANLVGNARVMATTLTRATTPVAARYLPRACP